jgi:hypothetical protein
MGRAAAVAQCRVVAGGGAGRRRPYAVRRGAAAQAARVDLLTETAIQRARVCRTAGPALARAMLGRLDCSRTAAEVAGNEFDELTALA